MNELGEQITDDPTYQFAKELENYSLASFDKLISFFKEERQRALDAEKKAERLLHIAEHLFQMVPVEAWREHGAEWMGQYEGDYHAEKLRDELAAMRASL